LIIFLKIGSIFFLNTHNDIAYVLCFGIGTAMYLDLTTWRDSNPGPYALVYATPPTEQAGV
jgi:hypothetical protein